MIYIRELNHKLEEIKLVYFGLTCVIFIIDKNMYWERNLDFFCSYFAVFLKLICKVFCDICFIYIRECMMQSVKKNHLL